MIVSTIVRCGQGVLISCSPPPPKVKQFKRHEFLVVNYIVDVVFGGTSRSPARDGMLSFSLGKHKMPLFQVLKKRNARSSIYNVML